MLPQKRPPPPHAASLRYVGCVDLLSHQNQTFFKLTPPQSPERATAVPIISVHHISVLLRVKSLSTFISTAPHACSQPAHAWDTHKFGRSHHTSDNVISHQIQLPTNKDVHLIVWFSNQPESYRKNHMAITLSVASPSDTNLTRTFVFS